MHVCALIYFTHWPILESKRYVPLQCHLNDLLFLFVVCKETQIGTLSLVSGFSTRPAISCKEPSCELLFAVITLSREAVNSNMEQWWNTSFLLSSKCLFHNACYFWYVTKTLQKGVRMVLAGGSCILVDVDRIEILSGIVCNRLTRSLSCFMPNTAANKSYFYTNRQTCIHRLL